MWYSYCVMNNDIKNLLKNQLATNPAWAIRGLVRIYTLQTAEEQAAQTTSQFNGVGFNGTDAFILSSFAQQVNAGRNLSQKQLAIVFKKLPKYWKQIASFIPEAKLEELKAKALAAKKAELPSTEEIVNNFPAATKVA